MGLSFNCYRLDYFVHDQSGLLHCVYFLLKSGWFEYLALFKPYLSIDLPTQQHDEPKIVHHLI